MHTHTKNLQQGHGHATLLLLFEELHELRHAFLIEWNNAGVQSDSI